MSQTHLRTAAFLAAAGYGVGAVLELVHDQPTTFTSTIDYLIEAGFVVGLAATRRRPRRTRTEVSGRSRRGSPWGSRPWATQPRWSRPAARWSSAARSSTGCSSPGCWPPSSDTSRAPSSTCSGGSPPAGGRGPAAGVRRLDGGQRSPRGTARPRRRRRHGRWPRAGRGLDRGRPAGVRAVRRGHRARRGGPGLTSPAAVSLRTHPWVRRAGWPPRRGLVTDARRQYLGSETTRASPMLARGDANRMDWFPCQPGSLHLPRCTTSVEVLAAAPAGRALGARRGRGMAERDRADRVERRRGSRTPRAPQPTLSGGMPKKQAPSPSSTAVCRISSEAIAASMCQNGTGQRASSRSVQPLSGSA